MARTGKLTSDLSVSQATRRTSIGDVCACLLAPRAY
jgi:hypothetical protein